MRKNWMKKSAVALVLMLSMTFSFPTQNAKASILMNEISKLQETILKTVDAKNMDDFALITGESIRINLKYPTSTVTVKDDNSVIEYNTVGQVLVVNAKKAGTAKYTVKHDGETLIKDAKITVYDKVTAKKGICSISKKKYQNQCYMFGDEAVKVQMNGAYPTGATGDLGAGARGSLAFKVIPATGLKSPGVTTKRSKEGWKSGHPFVISGFADVGKASTIQYKQTFISSTGKKYKAKQKIKLRVYMRPWFINLNGTKIESVTLKQGSSTTLKCDTSLSDYSVKIKDASNATTKLKGKNLTITGKKKGTSTVTVKMVNKSIKKRYGGSDAGFYTENYKIKVTVN